MAQRRHRPVIQLTLSPGAIAYLDEMAARLGTSRSAWIEQTIRKAAVQAVLTKSEEWWVAELPGVAGAYSQGKTRASARANLMSVLKDLEQLRREGLIK